MADRPCDCLRPKSSLCSCQHCQLVLCRVRHRSYLQARITRPKRHLPNTYEILLTPYYQFRKGGWVTFGEYFRGKEASPANHCWCQKTRVIALSCGIKISAVHHLVWPQYTYLTDGRMDGQTDRIATAIPCVALHAVAR